MSTSKDNLVGQFTMSLQAAMANVDEHYTVVGVAELWEESLEVAALKWESRNYISFERVCFLLSIDFWCLKKQLRYWNISCLTSFLELSTLTKGEVRRR